MPKRKGNPIVSPSATLIPPLTYVSDSIFELPDGLMRAVIEFRPLAMPYDQDDARRMHKQLRGLVEHLGLPMQFLLMCEPTDRSQTRLATARYPDGVDYLEWWRNYLAKWYASLVFMISKRTAYLTLAAPAGMGREEFEEKIAFAASWAQEISGHGEILGRQQVDALIGRFLYYNLYTHSGYQTAVSGAREPDISKMDGDLVVGKVRMRSFDISQRNKHLRHRGNTELLTLEYPFFTTFAILPDGRARASLTHAGLEREDLDHAWVIANRKLEFGDYEATQNAVGQRDAFKRSLPIFVDAGGDYVGYSKGGEDFDSSVDNNLSLFPCFSAVRDSHELIDLGFAASSLEPFTVAPDASLLLLSDESERLRAVLLPLTVRMAVHDMRMVHVGRAGGNRVFLDSVGVQWAPHAAQSHTFMSDDAGKSALRVARVEAQGDSLTADQVADVDRLLREMIESNAQHKSGCALMIEDADLVLQAQDGAAILTRWIQNARQAGCGVVVAASPSLVEQHPAVLGNFERTIVAGLNPSSVDCVASTFGFSSDVLGSMMSRYWMVFGAETPQMVRILLSPMEYVLYLAETKAEALAELEKVREARIHKNPRLSQTDSLRQAIYYWSIECRHQGHEFGNS